MTRKFRTEQIVDSTRLSEAEWQQLADTLDAKANARTYDSVADNRRHDRVAFRSDIAVSFLLKHPDGSWLGFTVRTRNLSDSGMGFFHGAFVHPGSRCVCAIKINKELIKMVGTVRRCNFVSGRIHEIGVEFDQLVDTPAILKGIEEAGRDTAA